MESSILISILSLLGGVLTGGMTMWVAMRAQRVDQEVENTKLWVGAYEKTFLDQRLIEYKKLWALTEATSSRNIQAFSSASAESLATALTQWYYRDGGLLLTSDSRRAFFNARTALDTFTQKDMPYVAKHFSALRTAICNDLNSRRGPTLNRTSALFEEETDVPEALFSRR